MRTPIVTTALLLPLAAAAQPASAPAPLPVEFPADAQALADAALHARLVGRVYRGQPAAGAGWRLEFKDSGYAFINTTNGGSDSGRWRVEGTKMCVAWQRFPGGCSEMRADREALYLKRTSNGEVVVLRPS